MDDYGIVGHFEINSVVVCSEPIEGVAVSEHFSEAFSVEISEVGLGDFKGIEEFKLSECIEEGNFRCTDFVEYYLEHGGIKARLG